ncbi:MAG: hypothetical protein AABY32_04205 [Nanoarchaeota archaeon]
MDIEKQKDKQIELFLKLYAGPDGELPMPDGNDIGYDSVFAEHFRQIAVEERELLGKMANQRFVD